MKTDEEIKTEIEYKKTLIKSEKWNRIFNGIKSTSSLFSLAIAVIILLLITYPESSFNKTLKQEMSDKEAATILVDVLQEKDEQVREHLVKILRKFYPKINKKYLEMEKEFAIETKNEWKEKLKTEQKRLENSTNELEKELITQNIRLLESDIIRIDQEITRIDQEIKEATKNNDK